MSGKKFWDVQMKADRVGELLLYGSIANSEFWGDEVTPKQIDTDLKALGELDILNVRINSGGGSIFAGQAIYSILKRHEAQSKVAYIDGLAASMASIIPLACHKVVMPNNALMMIHKPWAGASGNAELLRQRADLLDKMEEQAVDIYEEKTKLDRDKIKEMLAAETWMSAQEALELGFIDEIEADVKVAASLDGDFLIVGDIKVNIADFANFESIKNSLEPYRAEVVPPEPVADNNPPPVTDEQKEELSRIRKKIYKAYEEEK